MDDLGFWGRSWLLGIPLIALTVVVHVLGLGLLRAAFRRSIRPTPEEARFPVYHFAVQMSVVATLATALHLAEACIWAAAFLATGAVPDAHMAMLYSLNAMTAFGHVSIFLAPHLQMLGALEALNGLMLFGLTTAFLYGMIQRAWPGRDS